ncbi:MAG: major facilitator superfamily domain-containing protein [Linnemannia elongata]|nr:MAG: major facilitator superfamily domain-containing protein [Linnemannia elongata]
MSVPSTQHASATTTATTLRCSRFPMRYCILILSGLGLMISYADRSNMAVAIVAIGTEFDYNKAQQGIILASFFFGYIATPILGGILSDRYGGKAVLATGALIWTVFTVCTPLAAAAGLTWAVIARIGLGLGEGTWIPPCEQSKAVASVTALAYLGSVIALPTSSALVVSSWGWRGIFWLFGTLGLLWSITWQIFGASDPLSSTLISGKEARWISQQKRMDLIQGQDQEALHRLSDAANQADHVGQPEEENEQIRTMSSNGEPILYRPLSSIPLEQTTSRHSQGSNESALRTSSEEPPGEGVEPPVETQARILCESPLSITLCNSLGFFVMQSWIPTFYLDFYGVDIGKIGYFTVLPSAIQGAMGLFAGYLVKLAHTATMAMILVTIGMALNGFTMIGASAYQHDFCPEHAGFIFSLGNTAGSLPAIVGVYFVGFLLDGHGANRWDVIWTTVSALYFVGATAFVLLSTHRRL